MRSVFWSTASNPPSFWSHQSSVSSFIRRARSSASATIRRARCSAAFITSVRWTICSARARAAAMMSSPSRSIRDR